jgi:hypothetical protein
MHVPGNQMTHLVGMSCNHEMRGSIHSDKLRAPHALAEQRIGALHGQVTCPAAKNEDWDLDGGQ